MLAEYGRIIRPYLMRVLICGVDQRYAVKVPRFMPRLEKRSHGHDVHATQLPLSQRLDASPTGVGSLPGTERGNRHLRLVFQFAFEGFPLLWQSFRQGEGR